MNKRGFELSLNMIVIVVIALVFLGLAIGVIQGWFKTIDDTVPKIIPAANAIWQPTRDNPIAIVPSTINLARGDKKVISLEIYNYINSPVMCSLSITPNDETEESVVDFLYAKSNRDIDVGMIGQWSINVAPKRTAVSGSYLYIINADCVEFSKTIDLMVTVK